MTYRITPMTIWEDDIREVIADNRKPHCYAVWFITKTLHGEDHQWVADFKSRDDAIHFVRFKEGLEPNPKLCWIGDKKYELFPIAPGTGGACDGCVGHKNDDELCIDLGNCSEDDTADVTFIWKEASCLN